MAEELHMAENTLPNSASSQPKREGGRGRERRGGRKGGMEGRERQKGGRATEWWRETENKTDRHTKILGKLTLFSKHVI